MKTKLPFNSFFKLILFIPILYACSSDDDSGSQDPVYVPKVFEGNVVLTSQDDVDAFGLENYNEIDGSLLIGFSNQNVTNITNLNALSSLRSVQDGLTLQNNPTLASLEGLNGLSYINGGPLVIKNNEILTTTNALSLLSFRSLSVEDNPMLLNIDGLEGVRLSRGSIVINNNSALANINGLINLNSVEGEILFIAGNTSLASINGLNNLQFVSGDFVIRNTLIANLNTLESLENVSGSLFLSYNESLTNYCGLLPLIDSNGLDGSFSTKGNAYNPSIDNLNTDECSM